MKCYVIVRSSGEYSSREDTPTFVYRHKAKAVAQVTALVAVAGDIKRRVSSFSRVNEEPWDTFKKRMLVRYKALGYDAEPDLVVEWSLGEAKFVS